MKPLERWGRFNLVGAMGRAVQLGTLAFLNRWTGGQHYLWVSAAALELTLLHNFAWHRRFTWRDRESRAATGERCLRFHLSNGGVSLVGNLLLMRLLVHGAHMPVLGSNAAAIVCCSVLNFCLGDTWPFA